MQTEAMNKVWAVVILGLAACGGATKKTDVGGKAVAGGDVTAGLFEQGKAWTFTLETLTTPPVDMGEPTTVANGKMTCTVDSVQTVAAAKVSKISCKVDGDTSPGAGNAPSLYWVRTAQGLWSYDASLSDADVAKRVAAIDAKEMLLAATPAAHSNEIHDAEGALSVYWAKPGDDGAWCTGYTFAMGDEGGWEMCLKAGVGIVSGNWFEAGATTTEHRYK